jgi:hypothetical protein
MIQSLKLNEKRFGFEPEVTAKVSRLPKIRIYEVGISYYGRTFEEGKKINKICISFKIIRTINKKLISKESNNLILGETYISPIPGRTIMQPEMRANITAQATTSCIISLVATVINMINYLAVIGFKYNIASINYIKMNIYYEHRFY